MQAVVREGVVCEDADDGVLVEKAVEVNSWTTRLAETEGRCVQPESLTRWIEASIPKQVIESLQSKSILRQTSNRAGMIRKISSIGRM